MTSKSLMIVLFIFAILAGFSAASAATNPAIKVPADAAVFHASYRSKTISCISFSKRGKNFVYAGKLRRRGLFLRFNAASISKAQSCAARVLGKERTRLLRQVKKLIRARRTADQSCAASSGGSSSSSSAASLDLQRVVPERGPLSGGTEVEISGANFTSDTVVRIGNSPLLNAAYVDPQHIRGKVPPGTSSGYVDVAASNPSGSDVLERAFAYVGSSPLAAEICSNGKDDNANGATDESPCENVDDYLSNWKITGAVVDYAVFGNYPLYLETQAGRNVTMDTWDVSCVGQTGKEKSVSAERDFYCVGRSPNFLEWDMSVPAAGNYILMLGDVRNTQNHQLSVDRGAGWEKLPNILGSRKVSILMHSVGPYPSQIFYFLHLNAGKNRFRISNGQSFSFVTTAVLAEVMKQDRSFSNGVHPHLHFAQADVDAVISRRKTGALSTEQLDLLQSLKNEADGAMTITDFPGLGRDRQGRLESLTYSGILNENAAHLAKAKELFLQEVRWLKEVDGDYRDGDILMYGYDLRQAGTVVDLLENSFSDSERREVHDGLMMEAQRAALSNLAGNWWRYPEAGGWTSSHGQGGQLGLALYFTDELGKFNFDVSLLMMKTTLRDNIKIDGSYLQALGTYYGWDIRTMIYFADAMVKNPAAGGENLFEFSDRALQRYIHFMTYALGPTRLCMGPFGTENCSSYFYGEMGSVLLPAGDYYHDGSIRWLFENTVGSQRKAYRIGRFLPEAMLWLRSSVQPAMPETILPLGKNYREHDHAFMRTGWRDTDIAYMSRCGLSANHSEREHGSFILYADGHNYLQTYNGYYNTDPWIGAEFKNLILIDGKGQGDPGTSMTARMGQIDHLIHSSAADYSVCDNSYGYNLNPGDSSSQPVDYSTRKVIFVRPSAAQGGYFVMLDTIKAQGSNSHRYDFVLHPGCGKSDGNCHNPIQVSYESNQGFKLQPSGTDNNMKVRFVEPAPADMAYEILAMPGAGGYPDYLKVSRATSSQTGEFMAVLFPEAPPAGRVLPSLTRLTPAPGQTGMTLGTDTLIWSKNGSAIASAGIQSDARVAFMRNDGGLKLAFTLEGTYLEALGHRLTSTTVTNMTLKKEDQGYLIAVGDTAVGANLGAATIALSGLTGSYTVLVDGENRGTVSAQGGAVSVAITIEGVHEIRLTAG